MKREKLLLSNRPFTYTRLQIPGMPQNRTVHLYQWLDQFFHQNMGIKTKSLFHRPDQPFTIRRFFHPDTASQIHRFDDHRIVQLVNACQQFTLALYPFRFSKVHTRHDRNTLAALISLAATLFMPMADASTLLPV